MQFLRRCRYLFILVLLMAGACAALTLMLHFKLLAVPTGSMRPTVRPGDAVLVRAISGDDLRIGDVITYQPARYPVMSVTHRVIGIDRAGRRIFTRGDAESRADAPVSFDRVEGKVVAVAPGLGHWRSRLHRPAGATVLIFLPLSLVVVGELVRLRHRLVPVYRLTA